MSSISKKSIRRKLYLTIAVTICLSLFIFILNGVFLIRLRQFDQASVVEEEKEFFNFALKNQLRDINQLSNLIELMDKPVSNQKEIEALLYNFINYHDDYYQVRFIDSSKK